MPLHPLIERYSSLEEYVAETTRRAGEFAAREGVEQAIGALSRLAPFEFACPVHAGIATFRCDAAATEQINWREAVVCPECGLNARMRFCAALLTDWLSMQAAPRLYLTEQATLGYALLKRRFHHTIGSEFVHVPERIEHLQSYIRHITQDPSETLRIEDVTHLSFADRTFDAVASFDVLEHVPDFHGALAEMARVLRPDGRLLLTAPFLEGRQDTLVRARIEADGTLLHLEPPEFHGDPVSDGVLCFYHFGWDLLDWVRAAGFGKVEVATAWSPGLGLMGKQFAISALKT